MIQGGEWGNGQDAERGTADCSVPAATDAEGSDGRIRRGKVGTEGSGGRIRRGKVGTEGSGRKDQVRKGRNGRLKAEESDAEGSGGRLKTEEWRILWNLLKRNGGYF